MGERSGNMGADERVNSVRANVWHTFDRVNRKAGG